MLKTGDTPNHWFSVFHWITTSNMGSESFQTHRGVDMLDVPLTGSQCTRHHCFGLGNPLWPTWLLNNGSQSEHGKAEDASRKVRSHNASRPDMHVERGKNNKRQATDLQVSLTFCFTINAFLGLVDPNELPQLPAVVISHPMKMWSVHRGPMKTDTVWVLWTDKWWCHHSYWPHSLHDCYFGLLHSTSAKWQTRGIRCSLNHDLEPEHVKVFPRISTLYRPVDGTIAGLQTRYDTDAHISILFSHTFAV